MAALGREMLSGRLLGRAELLSLAESSRRHPHELLYWANRLRTQNFGRAVRLCSIIAGKLGGCSEDCKWCAQSAHYGQAHYTKRPDVAEIQAAAKWADERGAASFGIVNSGRYPSQADLDEASQAARAITSANSCPSIQVCASLGELTDQAAMQLAAAGITRYNHNLETSRAFYPRMVTTHSYDDRIKTLQTARRAGLSLCCGGIFGLGETWEDRVEMCLTLREQIQPDVVPLNFLHPIEPTPLASAEPLPAMEILRIIAIFRLAMPWVDIKIAGGREVNLRDMQSWIFFAGATSFLIGNYLTTSGRDAARDLTMIADLGLSVVGELPKRPRQAAPSR